MEKNRAQFFKSCFIPGKCLLAMLCLPQDLAASSVSAELHSEVPLLSYETNSENSRHLIFMNNPEFLWTSKGVCDLADEKTIATKTPCSTSLFHLKLLKSGRYRAWWEHRNMMPFHIRSGLLLSNTGQENVVVELEGEALEANSFRRGGHEFAQLLNSKNSPTDLIIKPGERVLLGHTSRKSISPGHFFAGVSDFNIKQGEVTLDEVVFRQQPALKLNPMGFSHRTIFGVHESLVYKGIANSSSVILRGGDFQIGDETPPGPLPVSYRFSDISGTDHSSGYCSPEQKPACVGSAIVPQSEPTQSTSWVTHIAPDPKDPNPKRKRAIMSDLVSLWMPESTEQCFSEWPPAAPGVLENCIFMSPRHHLYLPDFAQWRLPNWGNWAVHYKHPIRVTNHGQKMREIVLRVTADGPSPIAFRGSGVSDHWQQQFLDPRPGKGGQGTTILARMKIAPGESTPLVGEFVLSGPGAGTLQHQIEISP